MKTRTEKRVLRNVRRAKRHIAYAAGEDARRSAIESATRTYETEAGLLDAEIISRRDQFAHELEVWTGTRPAPGQLPAPIEADLRRARARRIGSVLALAIEILLFTAVLMGFAWERTPALLTATVTTVVLGFVLEMILLVAFGHENPHVTLARLRTVVIIPALVLFTPALAILLLGRIASGEVAITLLPFAELALWASTMSMLVIGAALGACADLLNWSSKDAEQFADCVALRSKLATELREASDSLRLMPPTATPRVALQAAQAATVVAALLFFMAMSSACGSGQAATPATVTAASVDVEADSASDLEIVIALDASGSMNKDGWNDAAATVWRQLPEIVAKTGATRISVRAFTTDGWTAPLLGEVELPRLVIPVVQGVEAGEAGLLPGIGKSVSEHNRKEHERVLAAAVVAHRREVADRLKTLEPAFTLPITTSECSDVLGVLARPSTHKGAAVFVIISDGIDTCHHLSNLPEPAEDVEVILVLVASEDLTAPGASASQFFAVKKTLMNAAPWLVVVPAFDADIVSSLEPN